MIDPTIYLSSEFNLIKDGGDFLAIDPDGEEGLLVVVRRDVQDEEVGAAERGREDTGVGVHSSADVAAWTLS